MIFLKNGLSKNGKAAGPDRATVVGGGGGVELEGAAAVDAGSHVA